MNRRPIIITSSVILAAVAWWAFRPELLFVNKTVNESFPAATSLVSSSATKVTDKPMAMESAIASGTFRSVAHETKGTATIHKLADGRRVLRLTDFMTSNGPDVRVLLVAASDAADSETVKSAGSIELAPLKGNVGDQNYDIPADVDLTKYRACTIWCNRFGVNFGTAALKSEAAGMPAADSMMSASTALKTGTFHSVAHETKGMATIHQLADGRRVLRLTDFMTSNGPDVRVLLVAAKDASDSDTVKNSGFVEVAPLKGNVGDQNYELPAGLDLSKYGSVTIWCNRFSVNFATAPLS